MSEEKRIEIIAEKHSFCSLLKKCKICIPNYQREYAQGRPNARATAIRINLINDYYLALTVSREVDLDFVFGGGESDFLPVDGQQRLTSLFLLHWYIFFRAARDEIELLRRFDYHTRTTSSSFCRMMCSKEMWNGADLIFSEERISGEIKNMPWFTGAMGSDPTVCSMLTVLDCIHSKFKNCGFASLSDTLVSEQCPITFYAMNMQDSLGGESGIKDLYIKMNARGLPLTDFEIFKAELQKKKETPANDLLAYYLENHGGDSPARRSELIGKFNNHYADFFFSVIDDSQIMDALDSKPKEQCFDRAMMNFVKEVFCLNYFVAVDDHENYTTRDYRNTYDKFKKMNGKIFTGFIEQNGKTFENSSEKNPKQLEVDASVFSIAFEKVIQLLDCFSLSSFSFGEKQPDRIGFNAKELFKKLAENAEESKTLSLSDMISRGALYEYLLMFGYPSDEDAKAAYDYWQRFVWKVTQNTDVKNLDEAVSVYKTFCSILHTCGKTVTAEALIQAISDCDIAGPAKLQLCEEAEKARLIFKTPGLRDEIEKAENYFCHGGQIWFMLALMDRSGASFSDVFALVQKIFCSDTEVTGTQSKQMRPEYASMFERAFLASTGDTSDCLLPMTETASTTLKFVSGNYSTLLSHDFAGIDNDNIKFIRVIDFLVKLVQESPSDTQQWFSDYIAKAMPAITSDWKKAFVENDLIDKEVPGFSFKNGFEPGWEDDIGNQYTRVFTTPERRIEWGELNSFALAVRLSERVPSLTYHPSKDERYLDSAGFPNCFFRLGDDKVAFYNGRFYRNTLSDADNLGNLCAAENALLTFDAT